MYDILLECSTYLLTYGCITSARPARNLLSTSLRYQFLGNKTWIICERALMSPIPISLYVTHNSENIQKLIFYVGIVRTKRIQSQQTTRRGFEPGTLACTCKFQGQGDLEPECPWILEHMMPACHHWCSDQIPLQQNKKRIRQDSNLCGQRPADFKSAPLTTPALILVHSQVWTPGLLH